MRTLEDQYGRTITETARDVWDCDGLRLETPGQSEAQVIAAFDSFAPVAADEPVDA